MNIDAFPLTWPVGWKRTTSRKRSLFKTNFARARDSLFHELQLMGVNSSTVVLSTNVPLRLDGLPYAGQANPSDPGAAVYFKLKEKAMVFACDNYISVTDNIWAICKTIEALRGIQRWGASDMLERSFVGFEALPAAPSDRKHWSEVLSVPKTATLDQVNEAYKKLAKKFHPDLVGSNEEIYRINKAWHEAEKELKR